MPALIVAFDGIVADTLSLRVEAITKAFVDAQLQSSQSTSHTTKQATSAHTSPDLPNSFCSSVIQYQLERNIAGRTISETINSLAAFISKQDATLKHDLEQATGGELDATACELVALRAERHYSQLLARGVALNTDILARMKASAEQGYRLIVRADSSRSQVEQQLSLADIEHLIAFTRCGDDPSLPDDYDSYSGNWRTIEDRLNTAGLPTSECTVIESRYSPRNTIAYYGENAATAASTTLTVSEVQSFTAAHTRIAWFESTLAWTRVEGNKATDTLNGLITNDIIQLTPGVGLYAAALAPKGKLVCDMVVMRNDSESYSIAIDKRAHKQWLDLTRKYVNPRLARVSDEQELFATFTICGPTAPSWLASLIDAPSGNSVHSETSVSIIPWSSCSAIVNSVPVRIITTPVLGPLPAFWLVVPSVHKEAVSTWLAAKHGQALSDQVSEILRIEAGWPAIGIDMDETTIPQEANLDLLHAISFNKGCYTGQETVARVHFRGHVNRHLRHVSSIIPLAEGTELFDVSGKVVGEVRSSAVSPANGPTAIAMLRREVAINSTIFANFHHSASAQTDSTESKSNVQAPKAMTIAKVHTLPATL